MSVYKLTCDMQILSDDEAPAPQKKIKLEVTDEDNVSRTPNAWTPNPRFAMPQIANVTYQNRGFMPPNNMHQNPPICMPQTVNVKMEPSDDQTEVTPPSSASKVSKQSPKTMSPGAREKAKARLRVELAKLNLKKIDTQERLDELEAEDNV